MEKAALTHNHHRTFFITAILVGALSIFVLVPFSNDRVWAPLIFPPLIVFFYGIYTLRASNPSEDLADSVYYLGFTFTLISLIVTTFSGIAGSIEMSTRTILVAFSTALLTTVIGVIFRILIIGFQAVQTQAAPEDLGREINQTVFDIKSMVGSLRGNLDDWSANQEDYWKDRRDKEAKLTADFLKDFRDNFSKEAKSLYESIFSELKDHESKIDKGVYEVINQTLASIKLVTETLNKRTEAFKQQNERANQVFADAQGTTTNNLQQLQKVLDQSIEDQTTIVGKQKAFIDAQWNAMSEAQDEALKAYLLATKTMSSKFKDQFKQASDHLVDVLNRSAGNLETINLKKISQTLEQEEAAISQHVKSFSKRLETILASIADDISQAGNLEEQFQGLYQRIERMTGMLSDQLGQIKTVQATYTKSIDEFNQTILDISATQNSGLVKRKTDKLTQNLELQNQVETSLSERFNDLNMSLEKLEENAKQAAQELNQRRKNINAVFDEAVDESKSFVGMMKSFIDFIYKNGNKLFLRLKIFSEKDNKKDS